jgi:hypothetical protein
MKYMKTMMAVTAFALAIGNAPAYDEPQIMGRSFASIAQYLNSDSGPVRMGQWLVWSNQYGVSIWCMFNAQNVCVEEIEMCDNPWSDANVVGYLAQEFGHAEDWKHWTIGPVGYWRDNARNSALYAYSAKDRKYMVMISRWDAGE